MNDLASVLLKFCFNKQNIKDISTWINEKMLFSLASDDSMLNILVFILKTVLSSKFSNFFFRFEILHKNRFGDFSCRLCKTNSHFVSIIGLMFEQFGNLLYLKYLSGY